MNEFVRHQSKEDASGIAKPSTRVRVGVGSRFKTEGDWGPRGYFYKTH